jgi:hypothetical protein
MIPALLLPEALAGSAEQLICPVRRPTFQPLHQCAHCNPGEDQHVDVIGHHHPCAEIIEPFLLLARTNRRRDKICDARI